MEGAGKIIVFGVLAVIVLGALGNGAASRSGTNVADANGGDTSETATEEVNERSSRSQASDRSVSSRSASRSSFRTSTDSATSVRPSGPPVITTISPHDVTHRSARVRGAIDLEGAVTGISFFIIAERQFDIDRAFARYQTVDELTNLADRITIEQLDTRVDEDAVYEERVHRLVGDLEYVYQLCFQYVTTAGQEVLRCGETESFRTDDDTRNQNYLREPAVRTGRVIEVSDHSAVVTGRVDMNDFREGIVFFVYGESEAQVEEVDVLYDSYRDVREDEEDLQRVRVDSLLNSEQEYELRIDDLDRSTEHFYQLCVEFDGERDGLRCGGTRSFETVTFGRDTHPDIFTEPARDVRSTSFAVRAEVDMNDYFDGFVFLIYGTDRDRVTDVPIRSDEYLDISQNGDRLQRLQLDPDLDGSDTYTTTVTGLQKNTPYWVTTCVEYEVADPRDIEREVPTLVCGEFQSVTPR